MIKKIFILFMSMLGTVLFFALFVFLFANSVTMVCTQQDGAFTCEIEKKLLDRVTTSHRTVSGVIAAQVDENCDNDGCSYRVELLTNNGGSEPFDDVFTDRGPMVDLANRINARIKQNDGLTFSFGQGMQWWVIILLVGLAAMSLGVELILVFITVYRWWVGRQQL